MKNDESAESEDDADEFDEKDKKKQRHAKESNLFKKIGITQKDEEDEIKRDFKTKVSTAQICTNVAIIFQAAGKDDDSDDFLKIKSKSADQSDLSEEEDGEKVKQAKEKEVVDKKRMNLVTDTELLARFYGDNDDNLDHNEKFLRSYILNEGWKEKASKTRASILPLGNADIEKQIDQEDQNREDEMDNFE